MRPACLSWLLYWQLPVKSLGLVVLKITYFWFSWRNGQATQRWIRLMTINSYEMAINHWKWNEFHTLFPSSDIYSHNLPLHFAISTGLIHAHSLRISLLRRMFHSESCFFLWTAILWNTLPRGSFPGTAILTVHEGHSLCIFDIIITLTSYHLFLFSYHTVHSIIF